MKTVKTATRPQLAPMANQTASAASRRTDELVIGLVGPVGSGVSFCGRLLTEILVNDYAYVGRVIKLSDLINQAAHRVKKEITKPDDSERISKLQEVGNELRKQFGKEYLSHLAVRDININRGNPDRPPQARRYFTVLDSIKHPHEVTALRDIYEDAFILIGVFAPETIRRRRLMTDGRTDAYVAGVLERDQADGSEFGQNVKATIEFSDFYVRNDGESDGKPKLALGRFFEILFGINVHTPTREEQAMQAATSVAAGSACMSRQVGAVLISEKGEMIGQGMNDVPRFGGGLYGSEDGDKDNRCWKWKNKECLNEIKKNKLMTSIGIELTNAEALKLDVGPKVSQAILKAGVGNLIEFSRSVHAEMEAIISAARAGKVGLVGSTLFTTTFPCHNCARHLVASGVKRVIYIEPYSKSLALELHSDSISVDEGDKDHKVVFLQYEGVAPRNVIRLFLQRAERKRDGRLYTKQRASASPSSKAPLDGFAIREQHVVAELEVNEVEHGQRKKREEEGEPKIV